MSAPTHFVHVYATVRVKLAVEAAFADAPAISPPDPLEAKIAAHDSKLTGEPLAIVAEEPEKLAEKRA